MRYGDIAEAPPPRNTDATITSPANGTTSDWGPFKSAASYGASMALVICVLFSAFAFALLLIAAAKFLLRRRRRPQPEKPPVISGGSTSCYFSGETELAGSSPICAICLSEFADGEKVRVLTPCRHGFHAECVEAWWVVSAGGGKPVRRSAPPCCPLCRAVVCDSSQEPEARTQVVDDAS